MKTIEFDLSKAGREVWDGPSYYDAAELRKILQGWLVSEPDDWGEQDAHCPLHDDTNASASMNLELGVWHCFAGCENGSLDVLADRVVNNDIPAPTLGKLRSKSDPEPLPSVGTLQGWSAALMSDRERLAWLVDKRFIDREVLEAELVGWDRERRAYALPVFSQGELQTVRFYRPKHDRPPGAKKMKSLRGHSVRGLLYPADTFSEDLRDPVVVCAGELDALMLRSHGFNAVTTVTGEAGIARTVAAHEDAFRGRAVAVVLDADTAGRKAAHATTDALEKLGAEAAGLDLPGQQGQDVTDLRRTLGWTFTEKLQLNIARALRGEPPEKPKLRIYTPGEMADMTIQYEWIIRDVLETKAHGPIAGAKKTVKSWYSLLLAAAVASGSKFLGRFEVEKQGKVLYLAGEGGLDLAELRLRHICGYLGIDRKDLPVYVTPSILQMGTNDWQREFSKAMNDLEPLLTLVDPIYPYHGDASSSNLYERGRMIMSAARPMLDSGSAVLMVDHWRKTNQGGDDLDNISGSGMGEFAHNWTTLAHLESPDLSAGQFVLRLGLGSRVWGGGQYRWDLTTGGWDGEAMTFDNALSFHVSDYEARTESGTANRIETDIMEVLDRRPFELTKTRLRDLISGSPAQVSSAMERLLDQELITTKDEPVEEGGRRVKRSVYGVAEAAVIRAQPDA